MHKKILQLGDPLVKCFQYDAYPLSILAADNDYLPWFYSNYIQLCCNKNYLVGDSCFYEKRPWHYNRYIPLNDKNIQEKNGIFLEFFGPNQAFSSPWIRLEKMSWDIINKSKIDIIEFIKVYIDNNYYFSGYIDEYYITDRKAYLKYHWAHDIFIYGYDDDKKIFYTSGYGKENIFKSTEVTYENFLKSFINNNQCKDKYYWTDNIYFFKKNNQTSYPLNIRLIYKLLEEYVFSRNSSENYSRYSTDITNMSFGVSVYETLIEYCELLLNEKVQVDLRIPNLLFEHKKCMKLRVAYIIRYYNAGTDYDFLYNQYENIERKTKLFQSLLIKYSLTKNKDIIKRIIKLLNEIKVQEYNTLCCLMEFLDSKL